jgi:hypothetical protein
VSQANIAAQRIAWDRLWDILLGPLGERLQPAAPALAPIVATIAPAGAHSVQQRRRAAAATAGARPRRGRKAGASG